MVLRWALEVAVVGARVEAERPLKGILQLRKKVTLYLVGQ